MNSAAIVSKPPERELITSKKVVSDQIELRNRQIRALQKANFDLEMKNEETYQRAIATSIVKIKEDIKESRAKSFLKILLVILSSLLVVSVVGVVVFYNMANSSQKSWMLEIAKNMNLSIELDSVKKKENLQKSIIIWNNELSKSPEELLMSDFSSNPINGTPERYIPLIEDSSSKWNVPASIISAQLWQESRFDENCVYLGYRHKEIAKWEQRWNSKRNAYDIYVQYNWDKKKRWYWYKGEVSVGAAQRNLGYESHDSVKLEDAINLQKSVDFVGSRWRDFLDLYPNESSLFLAMAYNNIRAANNGKSYLSLGRKDLTFMARFDKKPIDVENAKFIVRYGEDVVSIARNQRLQEIHDELFGEFKDDMEFKDKVPELKLLYVNQTDYHEFIKYEGDKA